MSLANGVIAPDPDAPDMFVGWAPAPAVHRRFLLGLLPAALVATSGVGAIVASQKADPGAGAWAPSATHKVRGVLVHKPYPMIRVADEGAPFGMRTILVVARGKCTSGLDLARAAGRAVVASGGLIARGERQMLEVPLATSSWFAVERADVPALLAEPATVSLGRATLTGLIMDTKCFFGVMRPSRGRTHKACASLCIRGGIPPSFWTPTIDGRESILLLTDAAGGPVGEAILPFVAERVRAAGEIVRVGDLLQFRADPDAWRRA